MIQNREGKLNTNEDGQDTPALYALLFAARFLSKINNRAFEKFGIDVDPDHIKLNTQIMFVKTLTTFTEN